MSDFGPDTTLALGHLDAAVKASKGDASDGTFGWRTGPERPTASPDQVHVWRIDLDAEAQPTNVLEAPLCEEERARAGRLVHARQRRRFAVHRAALRTILGRYLDILPPDLRFVAGPHGKPALAGAAALSGIRFSVSHSDCLALIAVAHSRELGVDIERVRSGVHLHGIARRFFNPAEAQALLSLPAGDQPTAFFRCWCSKEACLKALGVGLTGGQDVLKGAALPDDLLTTRRAPGWRWEYDRWSMSTLDIDAGFVAILAVEGPGYGCHGFRYHPPSRPPAETQRDEHDAP